MTRSRDDLLLAVAEVVGSRGYINAAIDKPAGPDSDFLSDLFSGAVWFRLLLGERRLDAGFTDSLVRSLLSLTRHGPD